MRRIVMMAFAALAALALTPADAKAQMVGWSKMGDTECSYNGPMHRALGYMHVLYWAGTMNWVSGGSFDPLAGIVSVFRHGSSGATFSQVRAPLAEAKLYYNGDIVVARMPSGYTVNVGREADVFTSPYSRVEETGRSSDRVCFFPDNILDWPQPGLSQVYNDPVWPLRKCASYSIAYVKGTPARFYGLTMLTPPIFRGFACYINEPISHIPADNVNLPDVQSDRAQYGITEVSRYSSRCRYISNRWINPAGVDLDSFGLTISEREPSGFDLFTLMLGAGGQSNYWTGVGLREGGDTFRNNCWKGGEVASAFQISYITQQLMEAGVDINNFARVMLPSKDSSDPPHMMIDGTGSRLCDERSIESDIVIATAPYKLGGVYCAVMWRSAAPTTGGGGGNFNLGSQTGSYQGSGVGGSAAAAPAVGRSSIGEGTRGAGGAAVGTGTPDSTSGLLGYQDMPR